MLTKRHIKTSGTNVKKFNADRRETLGRYHRLSDIAILQAGI